MSLYFRSHNELEDDLNYNNGKQFNKRKFDEAMQIIRTKIC